MIKNHDVLLPCVGGKVLFYTTVFFVEFLAASLDISQVEANQFADFMVNSALKGDFIWNYEDMHDHIR